MAKTVLTDASLTVNGVDLSDHCSAVAIEASADEVDVTGFTAAFRETMPGLQDATITATFYQDFASSEVDQTLWTLFTNGSTFSVVVKASTAATSSTNPSFTMTSRLYSYSPIAGAVGEASTTDVTFRNADQSTGVTRATA